MKPTKNLKILNDQEISEYLNGKINDLASKTAYNVIFSSPSAKQTIINKSIEKSTQFQSPESEKKKAEPLILNDSYTEKPVSNLPIKQERPLFPSEGLKPKQTEKEIEKKLIDDQCRYLSPSHQLKSNNFFLERRKEKLKEKLPKVEKNKIEEIPQPIYEPDDFVEIQRMPFDPIYQRASMAVEVEPDLANMEEIKGIERETLEGNKVIANWIEKNQKILEKSQKFAPLLKKKDEPSDKELESYALKKLGERMNFYNEEIKKEIIYQEKQKINEVKKEAIPNLNEEIKKNNNKKDKEIKIKENKINEQKKNNIKTNKFQNKLKIESPSPEIQSSPIKSNLQYNLNRSKTPKIKHENIFETINRAKTPDNKTIKRELFFNIKNEEKENLQIERENIVENNVLTNFSEEKFDIANRLFNIALDSLTLKSLKTLKILLNQNENALLVTKALICLISGFHENIPYDILEKKDDNLIKNILDSPTIILQCLFSFKENVKKNIVNENNILYSLNLLNFNTKLMDATQDFILGEIIRKISNVIESACEYYKIYKQSEIHNEMQRQSYDLKPEKIEKEKETPPESEVIIDTPPKEKISNTNTKEEKKRILLAKKSTIDVIMDASDNLAKVVMDYDLKTSGQPDRITMKKEKKSDNKKKNNHETKEKEFSNTVKEEYKDLIGNKIYDQLNNKIKRDNTKKLEKQNINKFKNSNNNVKKDISAIKNVNIELNDNFEKSKTILNENIKQTLQNISDVNSKLGKSKYIEEREVKKIQEEDEKKKLKQEIKQQNELEKKFREYLIQKRKNEERNIKDFKYEEYLNNKQQKKLENLQNQLRIKEEYMKTLEDVSWKDQQKQKKDIINKLTNEEKLEEFIKQRELRKKN